MSGKSISHRLYLILRPPHGFAIVDMLIVASELTQNGRCYSRSCHVTDLSSCRYFHWAFLRPPIDTLGMLGNVALLFVIRQPKFNSRTYSYIRWLAFADLATLTFDVFFLLSTVERWHRGFGFLISWLLCHILHPIFYTFGTWSAFMVVILTVHRLRAVWDPFAFRAQTRKPCYVALGAFLFSALINVVSFLQYMMLHIVKPRREGVELEVWCYACTWSAFHKRALIQDGYVFGREFVSKVLPVIMVFVLNIAIILVYRRRQAQGRILRSSTGQPDEEERRVVYMLLFIGTFYVLSMTPISLYIMAISTEGKYTTSRGFEIFRTAANLLANTQTASNFYLYCFCSRAVREEFIRVCKATLRDPRVLLLGGRRGFRRVQREQLRSEETTRF